MAISLPGWRKDLSAPDEESDGPLLGSARMWWKFSSARGWSSPKPAAASV